MKAFAVEQEYFSGPLGVLLNLLSEKKLEIKDVALAEIADEYLAYLDEHQPPTEELADFLVIASRLIYLKSRELMPYLRIDEEDEGVSALEDQLRLYRMFVNAADKLNALYETDVRIASRPYVRLKPQREPGFDGLGNISTSMLREAFQNLLRRLEPFFALQKASIERVKSVEERLGELTKAIKTRASMKFQDVVAGAKSKAEVVVSFLALLELARRQIVKVAQKKDQDIVIHRV